MTRPDYCPVAQEPCQAMCVLSDARCQIRDGKPLRPAGEADKAVYASISDNYNMQPQAEAVPAWTTEQITAVARPIAMAIAENCRTAPQLVFPHLFLGLKDLLTSTAPQQAEVVPTIYVSRGQLENLKPDPEDEAGTYLPVRKTPKGKFTHPLFAAPQQAEAVPSDVVRDAERWRTFLATRPANTHAVINQAIDDAATRKGGGV